MESVKNKTGTFKSIFSSLWLYNITVKRKSYKVTALMPNTCCREKAATLKHSQVEEGWASSTLAIIPTYCEGAFAFVCF